MPASGCFFVELRSLAGNRDQSVLESKQHQFRIALEIERLHDVVLVEFDGLLAQVQMTGDLLDRAALCEQLDDIALPFR